MLTGIERRVLDVLQQAVWKRKIPVETAKLAHAHLTNLLMHRLGIIDLRGDGPQLLAKLGVDIDDTGLLKGASLEHIADRLRRDGYDLTSLRDFSGDRQAGSTTASREKQAAEPSSAGVSQGSAEGADGERPGGLVVPPRGRRAKVDPNQLTLFQPAYHGSPHLFDRFSTDKIGTGEGAQAYGHGLYFASQKEVANWYRNTLRTGTPNPEWVRLNDEYRRAQDALDTLNGRMVDETIAAGATGRREDIAPSADVVARHRQEWDALAAKSHDIFARLEKTSATNPGRLYHVDVPEPHELMDWDKPLAAQPPGVRAKLEHLLREAEGADKLGLSLADFRKLPAEQRAMATPATLRHGLLKLNGDEVYSELAMAMSDPLTPAADFRAGRQQRAVVASATLADAGIPGHQYVGHESRATNFVVYDDSRVNIRDFEQASPDAAAARGAITFDENGASTIHLFDGADPSTAVHEAGHHFLTMFKSMAEHPDAPAQMRDDWNTVKAWWGENADAVAKDSAASGVTADDVRAVLATGTTGDRVKDLGVNVGFQEQWARAFEKYLRDGVSPSEGLRRAFEQFKAWLSSVYKSALALTDPNLVYDLQAKLDALGYYDDFEVDGVVKVELNPAGRPRRGHHAGGRPLAALLPRCPGSTPASAGEGRRPRRQGSRR